MTTSSLGTYFLLFFFLAAVASVSSEDCSYTILVKTGTVGSAGTNSKISAILKDASGAQLSIPDLEKHGKMGSGHDYFEKGNLDTFIVPATCLGSSVCSLTLSSDDKGSSSGWYVEFVQVLTTKGSSKAVGDDILFEIYGWLATSEPPYLLTRTFNRCSPSMLQQINAII
ncbi:Plat domain-containing protein [Thalictrum thalictroides]|uniref:Plat domain-containing protein n=1 Tax=Thalictrum thalictroides TaxID=46969 RepID=A0A7J6WXK9_THATH|nr:Plat domain-containing protein [Thalictrum thalictroides]